jgi:glutathione S-transferase
MPMKIFGVPISVHTRKVIAAARYKQLPYELSPVVPVLPEQLPPNWRTLSPTGLIPVLQDGDYLLPDSTAIVHYLERVKPSPSLLPSDAKQLGAALFLDAWSGSELFS